MCVHMYCAPLNALSSLLLMTPADMAKNDPHLRLMSCHHVTVILFQSLKLTHSKGGSETEEIFLLQFAVHRWIRWSQGQCYLQVWNYYNVGAF